MGTIGTDNYGHERYDSQATALTFGAVSTTAVGTISPTTAVGASPTCAAVTGFTCTDRRGKFAVLPVTGGGAQAAGAIVVVKFSKPYAVAPSLVLVQMEPITDPDDAVIVCATSVSVDGFSVLANSVLTTAETYYVSYIVIP
jgi:hypothetical protein